MLRLFAALKIPFDTALCLSHLRGGLAGARWIEAENYHLTLQFFGDVDTACADEIMSELARIKSPPFCITLKDVAVFTPKKPHSLYVAVAPCAELVALHEAVRRKVRHLHLKRDQRGFIPHVTVARLRHVDFASLAAYLERHGSFTTPAFEVEEFVLMSSRASVGGGPYVVEGAWPLEIR